MRAAASKKRHGKDETKPSEDGMEIQYRVTEDMLKKFEKADAAKVGGAGRVKKEKAVKRESGGPEDDFDEFDALVEAGEKPLVKTENTKAVGEKKPRAKKEPGEKKERAKKEPKAKDGLKQSKLDFGKKKGVSNLKKKLILTKKLIFLYPFDNRRKRRAAMMRFQILNLDLMILEDVHRQ